MRDVSTTMVYTHVLNRGPLGVMSPADRIALTPRASKPGGEGPQGHRLTGALAV